MIHSKTKRNLPDILILIGLLAAVCSLVIFPNESVSAAKEGLSLSAGVVLPSLFPFFVVSSLMIKTGAVEKVGKVLAPAVRRLFNTGTAGASAFIMGILGGYPLGAKTVANLYEHNCCTKSEAEHLLGFCSNSGPAFILGACGAGVFHSSSVGLLLLLSHVLAAVVVGIIFRKGCPTKSNAVFSSSGKLDAFPVAFVGAVKESFRSILDICGFVIFFAVIIEMLSKTSLLPDGFVGIQIQGFVELTAGILELNQFPKVLALPAASFMLGWGGLCVHCQALSFVLPLKLKTRKYFIGKFLHGLISALFTLAFCFII